MDKVVNTKRVTKQPKTKKKQQPLKVVYITNPIKFKTSASEFRALVQELTGQDADMSESGKYAEEYGVGGGHEAAKVIEEGYVHAVDQEDKESGHVMDSNSSGEVVQNGSDPLVYGSSYEDVFCTPEMVDNFPGLVAWYDAAHVDAM